MDEIKEWTIMFYFASDNPLAPSTVLQLKAIKDAGFHHDANVIAQFDPHTKDTPPHIFEVNVVNKRLAKGKSSVGFETTDPYVRNLVLDKIWSDKGIEKRIEQALNKKESGRRNAIKLNTPQLPLEMNEEQNPRASLRSFLNFCGKNYQARHYILFIMGHGLVVGNDMFLFDENAPQQTTMPTVVGKKATPRKGKKGENEGLAPQHSLTLKDLGELLRHFRDSDGEDRQLELVGFHSCSMSSVEVAYELQNTAKYMLASQGPAFVGSWPYKQMLLRVFNDLDSSLFKKADLVDRLALKLQARTDPVSKFLAGRFDDKTRKLLDRHDGSMEPEPALRNALVNELNILLKDRGLHKLKAFEQIAASKEFRQLINREPVGTDLMWLNRKLLSAAYPNDLAKKDEPSIRGMLIKLYYYALYNSYDFQMAGYSFDLTLCNLSKVNGLKGHLRELSSRLKDGLDEPLARDFILMAHWEAQSYYSENYTDLYDFCQCLETRCKVAETASKPSEVLLNLRDACSKVREKLARGRRCDGDKLDDKIIVRSEFVGPLYQYSRGLSVFFPWSEPTDRLFWRPVGDKRKPRDGYKGYKFTDTTWSTFLDEYFVKTRRAPHGADLGEDARQEHEESSTLVRELLEEVTGVIFNESGQLKHGSIDGVGGGKHGSVDPQGADCDCGSIKNYPRVTTDHGKGKGTTRIVPISTGFPDGFS